MLERSAFDRNKLKITKMREDQFKKETAQLSHKRASTTSQNVRPNAATPDLHISGGHFTKPDIFIQKTKVLNIPATTVKHEERKILISKDQ